MGVLFILTGVELNDGKFSDKIDGKELPSSIYLMFTKILSSRFSDFK